MARAQGGGEIESAEQSIVPNSKRHTALWSIGRQQILKRGNPSISHRSRARAQHDTTQIAIDGEESPRETSAHPWR
jgi:hypothetical protein